MTTPAWLVAKVDQRIALIKDQLLAAIEQNFDVLQMPLNEPDEWMSREPSKQEYATWDATCDGCGVDTRLCGGIYSGAQIVELEKIKVVFSFGVCHECRKGLVDE